MDILFIFFNAVSYCIYFLKHCVQGMARVTIHWQHAGLNAGQQDS